MLEAENIDQKTEDFINFIEGNVIEFENVDGGPSSGGSITDGIKTEWTLDSRWRILTDKGEYELYINQFTINDENPEYIGLDILKIYDLDVWFSVGDYIEDVYVQSDDLLTIIYNDEKFRFYYEIIGEDNMAYYPAEDLIDYMLDSSTTHEERQKVVCEEEDVEIIEDTVKSEYCIEDMIRVTYQYNDEVAVFTVGKDYCVVNGEEVYMNGSKAFLENDQIYIPIKYVMEGLGFSVLWDENTRSITIE